MNIKKFEDYEEFYNDSYTDFTYKLLEKIENHLKEIDDDFIKSEIITAAKMVAERCYKEGYVDATKFHMWLQEQIS